MHSKTTIFRQYLTLNGYLHPLGVFISYPSCLMKIHRLPQYKEYTTLLTKKDVEKLICNRFWLFISVTENKDFVLLFIGRGATDAYLAIRFELNGEITFPTHLAFNPPEYSRWDFDEEKQEILIFDTDNQLRIRGKLPTKWLSNSVQIQLFDGVDGILVHSPRFDASQVTERTLGGKNMYFVPRQAFNMEIFHDISREDFNLKVLDCQESILNFFDQAYEYIAQHPQLENVVLAKEGQPVIKLPEEDQLIFAKDAESPSFNYFAGSRARVIELLIIILSENNKRLLNPDDSRTEDELLTDVLNTQYSGQFTLTQV